MNAAWRTAGQGSPLFRDRADAGRRLGRRVAELALDDPVVVGLPRGGVPVAAEVATALAAPLDVIVVRKLGCPWHAELGFGAIGEGGARVIDREAVATLGITRDEVAAVTAREEAELARRVAAYRGARPPIDPDGRTVVLVDDGLATGSTARAAIQVLRERGAARIVLAVPVAPPGSDRDFAEVADDVVCLATPRWFLAIGAFYRDFAQTSDDEVSSLLAHHAADPADPADPPPPPEARSHHRPDHAWDGPVTVRVDGMPLDGRLTVPAAATGLVVFAHGSGSSRLSPRNRFVAGSLNARGLATLLFDLLTPDEARLRARVFDVRMLGHRLSEVVVWVGQHAEVGDLPVGLFGSSTGAAAALLSAAHLGRDVAAVVSRGGRPDLAGPELARVVSPTLLVVGGADDVVLGLNREAAARLRCPHELVEVPGAGHLFEEPGALEQVTQLAGDWFVEHLPDDRRRPEAAP